MGSASNSVSRSGTSSASGTADRQRSADRSDAADVKYQAHQTCSRSLISRARGGDEEALAELLKTVGIRHLERVAARKLPQQASCGQCEPEDVVQNCLLQVLTAQRDPSESAAFRGESEGQFCAWLTKILAHALHRNQRWDDAARHGGAADRRDMPLDSLADDPHSGPQRAAERGELQTAVQNALHRLSAADQEIVQQRVVERQPYQEIAARAGLTAGACCNRVRRALARLAEDSQLRAIDRPG